MKLSIIIVNFNTTELTLQCIRSISAFPPEDDYEIVLLDNGSEDDIEDKLNGLNAKIRLIKIGENTGFSKANNLGIQNSHGEFVLLLNSDTLITESVLTAVLSYMDAHSKVGALGVREIDKNGAYRLSCGSFPTFFSEVKRKIWHYRLSIQDYKLRDYLDAKHAALTQVDWVSGSCLLLRRKALQQTGLLDERFFMYFEDIDLCTRLRKKGWEVHYFSDASIVHYGGGSAYLNLMRVFTEYRHSEIYFARKYYGWAGEYGVRFFLFLKYACRFLRETPVLLIGKLAGRDINAPYTMMLLAKKVIEMAFQAQPSCPIEPGLRAVEKK